MGLLSLLSFGVIVNKFFHHKQGVFFGFQLCASSARTYQPAHSISMQMCLCYHPFLCEDHFLCPHFLLPPPPPHASPRPDVTGAP